MAINPPLNAQNEPLRITGEHFIFRRDEIIFSV